MAIYTQLSLIATPGKRYSFSAKAAADAAERPEGTFTALSVLGIPGIIHSFSAKAAAEAIQVSRSRELLLILPEEIYYASNSN